jgi:nuclear pore complex protein Nup62
MGQDLTSMIEEVNAASATLNKTTKADEPVSFHFFSQFNMNL